MSAGVRTPREPDNLTVTDLLSVAPANMRVEDDGTVTLGGIPLADLARDWGTALYVIDAGHFRGRLREYRRAFAELWPDSSVVYAAKALCTVATDRIVAEEGCSIDVASGGELAFAKAAGFPMERVFVQGNNKTPDEIGECLDAGVGMFVVDTHEELERISAAAIERGTVQRVVLRICPGVEADTHAYIQTANEDSKFGFNITCGAAREATGLALSLGGIELAGYHCHIGSQIFELSSYAEAVRVMFGFMDEMRRDLSFTAGTLDMGGGLGIAYTVSDEPPTVRSFVETLTGAVRECCSEFGYPAPHLCVEPGRSVAANAGITLYTVGSVKEVPGICTYVAIDGGMTDNIRTAIYGSEYEAFVVERAREPRSVICDVVGKHCESGDIVVRNSSLGPVSAGDHICVLGTGAYCHEMASNYNKQVRPGIVMVEDGEAREIVRRETYADLLRREV